MTGADSFAETTGGILAAVAAGLYTVTNTTLTARNVARAESVVDFVASLGVRTVACNALIHSGGGRGHPEALDDETLRKALIRLRGRADDLGLTLLWYTPTEYCRLSPIELDLTPRRCNAGEYSMCIEPNGDVLPCQSYYEPVGNILRDPWPRLWDSNLFRRFRVRRTDPRAAGLPERCWECEQLATCGGGCPLEREARGEAVPAAVREREVSAYGR
jgi:radical SAM protein with 4Fe4S-binding SPASM domain